MRREKRGKEERQAPRKMRPAPHLCPLSGCRVFAWSEEERFTVGGDRREDAPVSGRIGVVKK